MRSWKDKLTSRKFWAAVVGVIISVMVLFGVDTDTQQKTVAIVTASATLIAYIVGEGITDKAHVNDSNSTALYTALLKTLASTPFTGNNAEAVKEGEKDDNNNS